MAPTKKKAKKKTPARKKAAAKKTKERPPPPETVELERHALRGPLAEARLRAFEKRLGQKLPADYREFMLRFNGGVPAKRGLRVFNPIDDEWVETIFECFYPLHDDLVPDEYSTRLEESLESVLDVVRSNETADDAVPIGRDAAGNLLLLLVAEAAGGRVVFRDHDYDQCYELAESFSAFCEGLTVETDPDA